MTRLEKIYKLIEKYYWIIFIFLLISPNFFEPFWFWRWMAILVLASVFIVIFAWGYYAWLVLKKDPVSITTASKEHYKNITPSQRKWHLGLFYFGMFLAAPLILYMVSSPIVDTVKAVISSDHVRTADVTISDRTTFAGTWFIGQSLKVTEEDVSGGRLLLMFSIEHALEGEEYRVRYLPHSGLVLELDEI